MLLYETYPQIKKRSFVRLNAPLILDDATDPETLSIKILFLLAFKEEDKRDIGFIKKLLGIYEDDVGLKTRLIEVLFNFMKKNIIAIDIPFSALVDYIYSEKTDQKVIVTLLVPFEDYIELIKDEVYCITAYI